MTFNTNPKPKPNGFWETETETETEANTQYIAIFRFLDYRFLDYFFLDNLGSEQWTAMEKKSYIPSFFSQIS